nr:phospholipase-like protein [Tanacetum cinerariifolium]
MLRQIEEMKQLQAVPLPAAQNGYRLELVVELPVIVSSPQSGVTCVQGYTVKNINAPILESIFKKHGDIAATCVFKTSSARESILDAVCEVVRKIQTNDVTAIISDMDEIKSQVSGAEAIKMNVAWLRAHLEAIHRRAEAKKSCSLLMKMNANTSLVTRAAEMDLKEILSELTTVQERFEKAKGCVEIFLWGSYIWDHTYPKLRDALNKCQVSHDDKHEKGEEIRYTLTGFVYAFMIWILKAIPATHVYFSKEPREKIPKAFAWKMILSFSWARCLTLFVGDNLSPPLETLTPTKAESESDWWKTSLEYFEGKDVQSDAVSEQLEIEKDVISEEVQKKKKRKRDSSPPSFQNPTYDQLMTTVSTLGGTVTTLTQTVSSLQGSIGTLESRLLVLEGDARISTLTQTVSSLQGTIDNLESWLLALEGDERDFGVVSDGVIPAYMSLGPSYTSPASTAQKSLPLANRRKLRVRRTSLKLKSPMRCYSRKMRCTIPLPASTTMPPVTTILVPMTTTKLLKDIKDVTKDAAKDTISVPMTTTEKKTDCYLDCLPKGRTCEPSFWDILYPDGEKAEYLEEGKLDGLWTLGLSEPVAFHIESRKMMSMVSVVDALRATIDGTNPRYPSWHKISQTEYDVLLLAISDHSSSLLSIGFFPINLDNKHWVAASWNLDDYVFTVYDSLESPENY